MKSAHELVLAARQQIQEVSPAEAAAVLAGSVLLIDVREAQEFVAGHLPGALNVPRGLLEFKLPELLAAAPPAVPVLLYCKSGGRSALSALALQQMQCPGVLSMTGGFDAWSAEQRPVESPSLPSFD
jgi:rhodanese-related sulfurtransferase